MSLFVRQWGHAGNPPVLCVHGLTRNSLDFNPLANVLASNFYVLAPDMPGRGNTPPLEDSALYNNAYYAQLIGAWAASQNITQCAWVGTSMGGMIGLLMNAMQPGFITKLVLNDVGAVIPKDAITRLKTYVGVPLLFPTRALAEAALKQIYAGFGITEEADWRAFFDATLIERGGMLTMNYDLRIAESLQALPDEDLNLWPLVEALQIPTLLLRGEHSDLLLKETAEAMVAKNPHIQLVEIKGAGHAPALHTPEQIEIIQRFIALTKINTSANQAG